MRRFAFLALAACGSTSPPPLPEVTDTVAEVDPRIGTGGLGFAYGSCFVGAVAPHGLAKPGPDTNGPLGTVAFQHYSGYYAEDNRVRGFSSVHLHGAGATDYGILSVMPVAAFDASKTKVTDYETLFDKSTEKVAAGTYELTFANGIKAELTATPRVAVERYTGAGAIVIDLDKTLEGGKVDAATITVAGNEITGQLHHLGGMSAGFGGYTLYFVVHGTWSAVQTWSATQPPSGAASATGTGVGAALSASGPTTLAIGLSLVSIEGARANLAAEVPQLDFDAVAAATRAAWAQKLDVVKVTGGTEAERRTFYTGLYHSFLMPSVIDDVDGSFELAGGSAVEHADGYHQMSDLSLWDTYRTVAPLYAWLAPDSAASQARSLVAFGNGLGAYPKWPLAIGETGTMLGASAEIVYADAVARGVPGVDPNAAYPMLRAAAMDPGVAKRGGRDDVEAYMQYGYVPNTLGRSVSMTTEYAHDDFALAHLAAAVGDSATHDALIARSHGWRMLYDPATGFLRGRAPDGSFAGGAFDPTQQMSDYAEANAWQSLWETAIHDPDGMAMVLGGSDAAIAKLKDFFTRTKTDWESSDPAAANFPRPYYWAGNEPDINAAYLFAELGHPELTAQWVGWIVDTIYSDQPDGVPGNDDGGAMGAWYVLATLGFYPVAGSDQWIVGAPRFPKARIDVGGHELVIEAPDVSDDAMYVSGV
ncbi:MAG: GH92 family glycosyl hydrolase, partial [Deltaproteobacteria bacterium]|nr:GH92 family glycosyl hydrolase [Deltaproteobacteria bacterium]